MTFTPGCPFDGQTLGSSKPQVRNNFTNLFNNFAIDHVNGNDPTNPGRHNQSTYITLGAAPVTIANQTAIYASLGATTGTNTIPCLFIQPQNSAGPNLPYQLSNIRPVASTSGYSWLPGGLLLQWGSQAGSLPLTVTYPIAFTTAFQAIAISSDNARPIGISAVNASNFTYLMANPSAGVTVRWFAIGIK